LKTKEFFSSLHQSILIGDDILLPARVVRRLLTFAGISNSDVFYELGCGNGSMVAIAAREFKARKSVGIEIRKKVAIQARKKISYIANAEIRMGDIRTEPISDATLLFFWFTDQRIIKHMLKRFMIELKGQARILTILSPPDLMLPSKMDFPFFLFQKPFKFATSLQQQFELINHKPCIDFVESWSMAERYINELDVVPGQHRRFVNILQSVMIWINAWNTGIACENEIPAPVNSYLGILRTFFGIDLSDLISTTSRFK
jgi:trans-aconitate methyltransferase